MALPLCKQSIRQQSLLSASLHKRGLLRKALNVLALTPHRPIHNHYAPSRFCGIQFTLSCEIGPTRLPRLCVLMSERQTAPKRLLANTSKLLNGRVRVLASAPKKRLEKEILMSYCGAAQSGGRSLRLKMWTLRAEWRVQAFSTTWLGPTHYCTRERLGVHESEVCFTNVASLDLIKPESVLFY